MLEVNEVREKANKIGADMRAMLEKAKTEARELTAEEEGQFDAMDNDRNRLLATEKRLQAVASLEEGQGRRAAHTQPNDTRASQNATVKITDEDRAAAIQAWMLGGSDVRTQRHNEAAKKLGISPEQRSITIRLAEQPLPAIRGDRRDAWEKRYLGVDVISPDNGGHFLVPDELMRELEVARLAFGGMLTTSSVVRTTTGAALPFPTMNDTANEGVLIGESVQETNNLTPTLDQLVLDAYTYSSKKVPMSVEFIQDNAVGAVARIGAILGERLARIQNRHATVGTGNSQPNGLITAATSSAITTASAAAVSYDNIVDLE
ncbi:MAG TPA: phage major capsid protein, partial [Vicinamibacterales bacterium]|nr:phage major capsid protein [Vicinamibacterales bacterium]